MESNSRAALECAYRSTRYEVPVLDLVLIIGRLSHRLDRLLREYEVDECAFVSAANPHSRVTPAETNARQHQRLKAWVAARGLTCFEGVGVAMEGSWPAEPSLLVLGLSRDQAISLGRAFQQNAVVTAATGGEVTLVWCANF